MYGNMQRVRAHWSHSFDMHLGWGGGRSVSCVFTSWASSGLIVGNGYSLMSVRWQVFFPSWVPSGPTSSPSVVAAIANGWGILVYWFSRKLLTMPKPLTVWITTNCGKFLKRWEYQTTWPASWEICMQVRKQQLELDMKHQTGSKLGKEYVKAVYCHPAYLTYLQSTSCKMPAWMKHKLESRLPGEISITSDMQVTPPLWQKVKRN